MEIVHFLCRKTQTINLRSKELIRVLTAMIQQFNREKNETRIPAIPAKENTASADGKLSRVVARIIELMVTYFPSREHTSFFFRDLLGTSFDYVEMEGVKDGQSVVYLIMELLTQGFKDKFPFIYLYYTRIFAVEEGLATLIESQNLTAVADPREMTADCFRDPERDSASFFKHLPYRSIQL